MRLVSHPTDVSYLLDMTCDPNDHVSLLVGDEEKIVLCNSLTVDQMRATLPSEWEILDTREKHEQKIASLGSITIDPTRTTLSQLNKLKKLQPNIDEQENAILELRKVKSVHEVEKITASQRLNEEALKNVLQKVKLGITEKQIEQLIKIEYLTLGAQGWGFDPIVGFADHGANIHHKNTDRKLKKGDQILIDMGCILDGYHSDMTRVVFTDTPTTQQTEILDLLIEATYTSADYIQIGMRGGDIWDYGKSLLGKYGEYFPHCWGHGIGRDVHELPNILPGREDVICEGCVFTIEPGIYIPGVIGARFEQIVVVEDGKLRMITQAPEKIKLEIF